MSVAFFPPFKQIIHLSGFSRRLLHMLSLLSALAFIQCPFPCLPSFPNKIMNESLSRSPWARSAYRAYCISKCKGCQGLLGTCHPQFYILLCTSSDRAQLQRRSPGVWQSQAFYHHRKEPKTKADNYIVGRSRFLLSIAPLG